MSDERGETAGHPNVRAYDGAVRRRAPSAIERIDDAEAAASGAHGSPERAPGCFHKVETSWTT
jgi:hypothetical protein